MKPFSASEAAFEGFRILRRHPGAVVAWALGAVLFQLAITGLMLSMIGPRMALLSQYSGAGATVPPDVAMQAMGPMAGGFLLVAPLSMVFSAIVLSAVFRPVLRPQDKGLFFFKIGRDELNIFLLQLAWIGVFIAAEIVLVIGGILVGVGFATAMKGQTMPPGAAVGFVGGGVVLLCVLIWLAVRFSLAAPMTFAEKRVRVFGSWGLTRGRFWALLGCYLLAAIFAIIISLVGGLVAGAIVAALFGVGMTAPQLSFVGGNAALAMAHMFTVGGIVQVLVAAVFNTIGNVVVIGAVAGAYRGLTYAPEEDVFSDAPIRPAGQGLVL